MIGRYVYFVEASLRNVVGWLFGLMVLLLTVSLAFANTDEYPTEPEADVREDEESGEHSVVMKQRFDYPMKDLYHVLTDYKNFPDYMPHTRQSDVEKVRGNTKWVRYRLVFLLWFEVEYLLKIVHDYKDTEAKIAWDLASGDYFYVVKGFWHLKSLSKSSTGVTYDSLIEPKVAIPGPILRLITQQSVYDLFSAVAERLEETIGPPAKFTAPTQKSNDAKSKSAADSSTQNKSSEPEKAQDTQKPKQEDQKKPSKKAPSKSEFLEMKP